jgi:hypothetical protein
MNKPLEGEGGGVNVVYPHLISFVVPYVHHEPIMFLGFPLARN